jgi:hypothetical protein
MTDTNVAEIKITYIASLSISQHLQKAVLALEGVTSLNPRPCKSNGITIAEVFVDGGDVNCCPFSLGTTVEHAA